MDDKPLRPLGVRTRAHERAVRTVRLLQAERDGWRLKAEKFEAERNEERTNHHATRVHLNQTKELLLKEERRANGMTSELRRLDQLERDLQRANLALVHALIGGGR